MTLEDSHCQIVTKRSNPLGLEKHAQQNPHADKRCSERKKDVQPEEEDESYVVHERVGAAPKPFIALALWCALWCSSRFLLRIEPFIEQQLLAEHTTASITIPKEACKRRDKRQETKEARDPHQCLVEGPCELRLFGVPPFVGAEEIEGHSAEMDGASTRTHNANKIVLHRCLV